MKALIIASVAAAATMAFSHSPAFSQANCQGEYTACMTSCASKSSKQGQDSCFGNCENNNNLCSERIYGKKPFNGTPSNVAEQQGKAKASSAAARTVKPAAAGGQVAEQEAAPQQAEQPQQAPRR